MTLRYLLDTNILSEAARARPDDEVMRQLSLVGASAATAAPVWHELEYGCARLPRGRRRREIEALLAELEQALIVLPYDAAAARWHARERARLSRAGQSPPFVDGQIAAIAAVHGLCVVTRNVRDFRRFRGVSVESWFSS